MAEKYILDTQALIWYLEGNPQLGAKARAALDDAQREFVLPVMVLVEVTTLIEQGKAALSALPDVLNSILADSRITIHPLTWEVFHQSLLLKAIPDMHDRLIVSTALHLRSAGDTVFLLTQDAKLAEAKWVSVVW